MKNINFASALMMVFLIGCSSDGNQKSGLTEPTAAPSSLQANGNQSDSALSSLNANAESTSQVSSDSSEPTAVVDGAGIPCIFDEEMEQISAPLDITQLDNNQAITLGISIEEHNGTVKVTGTMDQDLGTLYLVHNIEYGDGYQTNGDIGWHTYAASGTYAIQYNVSDGVNHYGVQRNVTVNLDPFADNRAPLALFLFSSERGASITNKSFDIEADELSHQWLIESPECGRWLKTGDGPFHVGIEDADEIDRTSIYLKVSHTVSDGSLGDTQTTARSIDAFSVADPTPSMKPTYLSTDDGIFVSARYSEDFTSFFWEFDDGTSSSDAEYFHPVDQPGEHIIKLIGSSFIGSSIDEISVNLAEQNTAP